MSELKPCPFCGGEAELTITGTPQFGAFIIVKCMSCGSKSKGSYFRGVEPDWPLEETNGGVCEIKLWNRRIRECYRK